MEKVGVTSDQSSVMLPSIVVLRRPPCGLAVPLRLASSDLKMR
jgi:hypothetical protein